VKPADYEQHLRDFHAVLQSAGLPTLRASTSYRIGGLPWINEGRTAYEDWYVVDDWAAFGPLNSIAVGGDRKNPHDQAAHAMQLGAGGIYGCRFENQGEPVATYAHWLSKPKGMTYDEFDALAKPLLGAGAMLWRRMMVLGPGLEFCLTSPEPVAFPAPLQAVRLAREQIVDGASV
jgi:hypothetical protein